MFGTNFFQDNLEGLRPGFMLDDYSQYLNPRLDLYDNEALSKDFSNLPSFFDVDYIDPKNLIQMLHEGINHLPVEMKNWLQMPYDFMMPQVDDSKLCVPPTILENSPNFPSLHKKIGTLTLEERYRKVKKFLEKRKLRNYKKKISYMCRKKVADNRIRVKGRFVSKTQAETIIFEKKN